MADVLSKLLSARVPPAFAELHPYVPDPTVAPVRLDANEAPPLLPTLTKEERALWNETLSAIEPARYPDVRARALRAALSESMNVDGDSIVIGTGSDEVIQILLSTFARGIDGRAPVVLTPSPTFVMYRVSARVHGYDVVEVALDEWGGVRVDAMIEAMRAHRPAVVFLATPNNPTSAAYEKNAVFRVVQEAAALDPPTLVVVDEAYLPFRLGDGDAAFADPWQGVTGLHLLAQHDNVVVLRTLSKIGLAALRVGWLVGRPALVAQMEKARLPYDLPSYSQAGAVAALGALRPAIERHVRSIVAERKRLVLEVGQLSGVSLTRADANFLWTKLPRPAADVARALKERGVLVRAFAHSPSHLRITVGTREEDDRLLGALREALA